MKIFHLLLFPVLLLGCKPDDSATRLNDQANGLKEEAQYYVYVDFIEVGPNKPDGDQWDRDKSGPDLRYSISWQGNEIFKSEKRKDSLVAEWKATEMGVGIGTDNLVKGESSVIGARITARKGPLTFKIWEEDPAFNDEAGHFEVQIEDLKEGRNEVSNAPSIIKMVIVVTPIPPIEER
jgi:hypothetical protein